MNSVRIIIFSSCLSLSNGRGGLSSVYMKSLGSKFTTTSLHVSYLSAVRLVNGRISGWRAWRSRPKRRASCHRHPSPSLRVAHNLAAAVEMERDADADILRVHHARNDVPVVWIAPFRASSFALRQLAAPIVFLPPRDASWLDRFAPRRRTHPPCSKERTLRQPACRFHARTRTWRFPFFLVLAGLRVGTCRLGVGLRLALGIRLRVRLGIRLRIRPRLRLNLSLPSAQAWACLPASAFPGAVGSFFGSSFGLSGVASWRHRQCVRDGESSDFSGCSCVFGSGLGSGFGGVGSGLGVWVQVSASAGSARTSAAWAQASAQARRPAAGLPSAPSGSP